MSVRPENNYRKDESLDKILQTKSNRINGGDCLTEISEIFVMGND